MTEYNGSSEAPCPASQLHSEEGDLDRVALEDPAAAEVLGLRETPPTVWRTVAVILFAVFALAVVFWRGR